MRRFNLSEWALSNRPLVLFAMLAFALIGAWSYKHLGQSEDPPFTFKAMVVRTLWPGATAEQVSRQVTEPIEKALMNTGEYEFIRSYSRPGGREVVCAGDVQESAVAELGEPLDDRDDGRAVGEFADAAHLLDQAHDMLGTIGIVQLEPLAP